MRRLDIYGVFLLFGATVAQLDEDEFQCMVEQTQWVLDLKRILADRVGCSRFRLRLFGHGIGELLDDMHQFMLPLMSAAWNLCSCCWKLELTNMLQLQQLKKGHGLCPMQLRMAT